MFLSIKAIENSPKLVYSYQILVLQRKSSWSEASSRSFYKPGSDIRFKAKSDWFTYLWEITMPEGGSWCLEKRRSCNHVARKMLQGITGQNIPSKSLQMTQNWGGGGGGAVNTLAGRAAIQRDLDGLEQWADRNLIKFNRANAKSYPWEGTNPGNDTGLRQANWGAALQKKAQLGPTASTAQASSVSWQQRWPAEFWAVQTEARTVDWVRWLTPFTWHSLDCI